MLVKVILFLTHAHLFCHSSPSPLALPFEWALVRTKGALLGVFLHHGITQTALIPILCAMNYFFACFLNSSVPKSVTRDLIKLHLITQGCPSGLTPSFPEEFSPDLLNSSQVLSGRPLGAVPCACWVTGIYTAF